MTGRADLVGGPEDLSGGSPGRAAALAAITIAVVLWGLAPVATRYLVLTADPLGVLAIRLLLCSLCYLPALPWMGLGTVTWSRRRLLAVAVCGLAGIIGYNLPVTYGIQHVRAGFAGILLATEPLWIALLSVAVLKQRLTVSLLCGLVVAFAGVVTISVGSGAAIGGSALLGVLLVPVGAFMWGLYSVAVGPLVRDLGAIRVSALTLWVGTVPLVALSARAMVAAGQSLTPTGWLVLALYGLGPNLIGMLLWNVGLSRVPGTTAGLLLNLYPVVSVAGGVSLLGEDVTVPTVAGGAVVVFGLVLAQDNAVSRFLIPRR